MKDKIREFVDSLEGVPRFAHNHHSDRVYYGGPDFGKEELVEAIDTLLYGKWATSGEKVAEFESETAKYLNQAHALMVNSGSSANLIAITSAKRRFGWADGDEIVLSVVGFPTTLNPILQNNLQPVFADIEFDTLNFDLDEVESKITARTRAIFVSPVLGSPPDIDRLLQISERHNVLLLLDCCDSLGSKWDRRHLSEYFYLSTLSFYPAHHISTMQGGMVLSNDSELLRIARNLTTWGRSCYCSGIENLLQNGMCGKRFSKWIDCLDFEIDHKYFFTEIGYNLAPLDLQGAIGLVQLKRLDEIHRIRQSNKEEISRIFDPLVTTFEALPQADTSWFGVPLMGAPPLKRRLVAHLEKNWVQTRNYFAGNILMHPAYSHLGDYRDFPNASRVLSEVFFVGCSQMLGADKISRIREVVEQFKEA